MLNRRLPAILCVLLGALSIAALEVLPAHASGENWKVEVDTGGGSGGGDPAGGDAPAGDPYCYSGGSVIDCQGPNGGWWNGTCYESVWANNPEEAQVAWDPNNGDYWPTGPRQGVTDGWTTLAPPGRTDGVIKQCWLANGSFGGFYWEETAAPPPSAAELEQTARLMLEGRITAPGIGVYPGWIDGTDPEAPGIIYWPTWLWADNPGEGIAQPLTQTTTVKGYTLRATARLTDIVYDTGDGKKVTCGLGARPTGRNLTEPANPPPRCGHTYTDRGHYTITATTHVTVDWSGAGRAGTIPITVSRSGRYDVAEVQVLIIPSPHR